MLMIDLPFWFLVVLGDSIELDMKNDIVTLSPSGVSRKLLQIPSIKKNSKLFFCQIDVINSPFLKFTYSTRSVILSIDLSEIDVTELIMRLILSYIPLLF